MIRLNYIVHKFENKTIFSVQKQNQTSFYVTFDYWISLLNLKFKKIKLYISSN